MPELRVSHADRRGVIKTLRVAAREGRLDATEFDSRLRAADVAKTWGELVRLHADLPDGKDGDSWAPRYRISAADRQRLLGWLADALTEGRLTEREYEQRVLAAVQAATYGDLRPVLDGVPGAPGVAGEDVLVSATDCEAALRGLDEAVSDGRLSVGERDAFEADVRRAGRRRELDAVAVDLDRRASTDERNEVVRLLDAARAEGRLDPAEHVERVQLADAATTDADLARLLSDLRLERRRRRRRDTAHRISHKEREQAARQLKQALDDGRLDLTEYDDRVAAAYAARTRADVDTLLADLIEPDPPREPDVLDYLYDRWGVWLRYSRGIPMVKVGSGEFAPRPGMVDYVLHKRVWQAVMLLGWGGFAVGLVAVVVGAVVDIERYQALLLLWTVAVSQVWLWISLFYTYAVVRRAALRRRGRPRDDEGQDER